MTGHVGKNRPVDNGMSGEDVTATEREAVAVTEPWEGEHCQDCGHGYGDVYWLPDAWWRAICPDRSRPEAGLLCPDCALKRLRAAFVCRSGRGCI